MKWAWCSSWLSFGTTRCKGEFVAKLKAKSGSNLKEVQKPSPVFPFSFWLYVNYTFNKQGTFFSHLFEWKRWHKVSPLVLHWGVEQKITQSAIHLRDLVCPCPAWPVLWWKEFKAVVYIGEEYNDKEQKVNRKDGINLLRTVHLIDVQKQGTVHAPRWTFTCYQK